MIAVTDNDHRLTLVMIEGGLSAIAIAMAFAFPGLGGGFFAKVERAFGYLARRKGLAVAVTGAGMLLSRLAILPWMPVPRPFLPDDFSFLLAAQTFSSARLTNPTPAMWIHFETIHITMAPTYMSMYFPAQGIAMAIGEVLFGSPWFGILLSSALMCAAVCWALQAWLPPAWSFLGGAVAVMRIALFSYWTNTYSGGGSIAALGGALVLGALPRFLKTPRMRYSVVMAVGAALLALSRPYEGILLCLPVTAVLLRWFPLEKNRPLSLLRLAAAPIAIVIAAGAWYGYYNYRVFGSPLTPPYSVDRAQYAMAPYFVWQKERAEPAYRHAVMRQFYHQDELNNFREIHSIFGFIPQSLLKVARGVLFYAGLVLLIPLIMLRRALLDRRIRFLVLCVAVLIAGQAVEIFLIPHYLAPFTVAFYAIGLQAMRHLRHWRPGSQPVGLTLSQLIVSICIVLAGVRVFASPLQISLPVWPAGWASEWYGPAPAGGERAQIEAELEQLPGKQIALVRYAPSHNPLIEWIYNDADIDHSKVIWAWDMGPQQNRELLDYYKDRNVWLVQPDVQPVSISPYRLPAQATPSALNEAMVSAAAGPQNKESRP